jgi:hypothetical protein
LLTDALNSVADVAARYLQRREIRKRSVISLSPSHIKLNMNFALSTGGNVTMATRKKKGRKGARPMLDDGPGPHTARKKKATKKK